MHASVGLSFDKQTSRDSFKARKGYDTPMGPHEKRFESFNTINTSVTKYKEQDLAPPFYKSQSRQQLEDFESKIHQKVLHTYDVDYSLVLPGNSGRVPDFSK